MSWIPGEQVAQCPNAELRAGMRRLADRAVELSGGTAEALSRRARLLLAFRDWRPAQRDLEAVLATEQAPVRHYYWAALVALATDDQPRYRHICRKVLTKFSESKEPSEMHFTAWTCALAPAAVDDYIPALALAEQAVEREPENRQCRISLGAVRTRAGRYEEALDSLAKAADLAENENTSHAYVAYFRAIAEHRLGRDESARASLQQANEHAQREFADADHSPRWNRRLTLELLRKEAERLIGAPAAPDAPGSSGGTQPEASGGEAPDSPPSSADGSPEEQ